VEEFAVGKSNQTLKICISCYTKKIEDEEIKFGPFKAQIDEYKLKFPLCARTGLPIPPDGGKFRYSGEIYVYPTDYRYYSSLSCSLEEQLRLQRVELAKCVDRVLTDKEMEKMNKEVLKARKKIQQEERLKEVEKFKELEKLKEEKLNLERLKENVKLSEAYINFREELIKSKEKRLKKRKILEEEQEEEEEDFHP
jgi:hypothetical protein